MYVLSIRKMKSQMKNGDTIYFSIKRFTICFTIDILFAEVLEKKKISKGWTFSMDVERKKCFFTRISIKRKKGISQRKIATGRKWRKKKTFQHSAEANET